MRYVIPSSFFLVLLSVACTGTAPQEAHQTAPSPATTPEMLRIASFNIWELSREKLDRLDADGRGNDPQLRGAAEIVQRVRPDVLLLNEIDFDEERTNARLFIERYLAVPQADGLEGIDYPHVFFEAVNTGYPSGHDFDGDGAVDSPEDAYGYGRYPGQYGMALLSKKPLDAAAARTFQKLPWHLQPGHLMPDGRDGKPAWYGPDAAEIFRLSSKSHWDVPVVVGERVIHLLASHPTPPSFDGDEDRNGRRNFDEIRLWADYLTGGEAAAYLVDDAGRQGGLDAEASFVVLGDLNADPHNDPDVYGRTAISQLLEHPRVQDPLPKSPGSSDAEIAERRRPFQGPRDFLTSDWGRLDYVLPSRDLKVRDSGVFWPTADDPLHRLVTGKEASSDHHLVWIDVLIGGDTD